ncbi:DNA ligase [Paenibacillus sp. GCM10027626]|uniref:ATP-dependent DNA ligase n=1 Tax=Paenibacillus sp. GCM10027626 TaxID=3273411 RepID=UPI00364520C5
MKSDKDHGRLNSSESAALAFRAPLTGPMIPISAELLPEGDDWGYQLKWDGFRMLARIAPNSNRPVELFSRNLTLLNERYPELFRQISAVAPAIGTCLLDGELIWWDGTKPQFQRVLQRGGRVPLSSSPPALLPGVNNARFAAEAPAGSFAYVLFDLLEEGSENLRSLPYGERYRRLNNKFRQPYHFMFVTDLLPDGQAIWEWAAKHHWEGVVSKRLSAPYREGKKHRDCFKKKTALLLDVDIVGLKWREQRVASLIMALHGGYIGSVSLGLTEAMRQVLAATFKQASPANLPCPFPVLPADLKRETVQWLPVSFRCRVTGLQITESGQIRHPKLVTFLTKEQAT